MWVFPKNTKWRPTLKCQYRFGVSQHRRLKHANCSRKLEVRRTSLQCRGLVVRPPGILAMNAWGAHGTEVIDRKVTKLLEVTLIGENYQKTPMEVPSCRQHIASSQEMGKTSAWRCLSRQSKPWTTPSYSYYKVQGQGIAGLKSVKCTRTNGGQRHL